MSKQKRVDVKEEFYKLYNDIDRTAGLSKAKKNRLERFRNKMAVDFYNLQIPLDQNYLKMTLKEIFEKCGDQIKVFRDKYIFYQGLETVEFKAPGDITFEKPVIFEMESSDCFMCSLIIDHKTFKAIVDKVIDGKEMTTTEMLHIQNKFYGTINQVDGSSVLLNTFYTKNLGVFRALYEFVILLSYKTINVKRCEEPTCKRLYIPTARGHDQKYCKNSCKMRSFRRLNKKVLLDK